MSLNKVFSLGIRDTVFKKREKTIAALLLGFTFLLVLLLKELVRPHFQGSGLFPFFLGVSPNLLPAIAAPFVFILFNKESSWPIKRDGFLSNCIVVFISLIFHEFIRSRKGILFDWNDIFASLIGCAISYFIYTKLWKVYFQKIS